MTTAISTQMLAGSPMLYYARTEAIESRRVKIRKLMARGFNGAQMASALGVNRDVIFKDVSSIRKYIAQELQNSDALALIAESLGILNEVRVSALKDMDTAETVHERAMARRDIMRVESECIKCIALVVGGSGRGMLNVTKTIESDPVPLMEEKHQKLMEVANKLAGEVLLVDDTSLSASPPTPN